MKSNSIVKHCDNRSKNDPIPVQLVQKNLIFAVYWDFKRKTLRSKDQPSHKED